MKSWSCTGDRLILDAEAGRLLHPAGLSTMRLEPVLTGGVRIVMRATASDRAAGESSLVVRLIPASAQAEAEGFGVRISGDSVSLFPDSARAGEAPHDLGRGAPGELRIDARGAAVILRADGSKADELRLPEVPQQLRIEISLAGNVAIDYLEVRARPDEKWMEERINSRQSSARGLVLRAGAAGGTEAVDLCRKALAEYPDRREECCLAEIELGGVEFARGDAAAGISRLQRALTLYPSQAERHHARARAELEARLRPEVDK
jgi:hypothetical protein